MSDHTVQSSPRRLLPARAPRSTIPRCARAFAARWTSCKARATQFPDDTELQQLRDLGEAVRQHALAQLPALLERLETKLTEAGVHVHWAETAAEANAIVLGIAQAKKARRVIKGKSMASEEIELNHALAEHGVDCIESDMGEFIVQLAGEKPSHIVMPAIHKTRGDIAELFQEHIPGTRYTEDVDELIQTGRRALRRAFAEADIGLSGVNFAAADTARCGSSRTKATAACRRRCPTRTSRSWGSRRSSRSSSTSCRCRACSRARPPASDHDLLQPDLSLRRDGERDGPREPHLVLLDNGRTQAYADEQLRATLQCIRCGACMNHCPVYTRIGGHAYGTTYQPDRQDHLAAPARPRRDGRPADRVDVVRRLRRGMPGADSDPAAARAAAHRSEPQARRFRRASAARLRANYNRAEDLVWRFWSGRSRTCARTARSAGPRRGCVR